MEAIFELFGEGKKETVYGGLLGMGGLMEWCSGVSSLRIETLEGRQGATEAVKMVEVFLGRRNLDIDQEGTRTVSNQKAKVEEPRRGERNPG